MPQRAQLSIGKPITLRKYLLLDRQVYGSGMHNIAACARYCDREVFRSIRYGPSR